MSAMDAEQEAIGVTQCDCRTSDYWNVLHLDPYIVRLPPELSISKNFYTGKVKIERKKKSEILNTLNTIAAEI